MVPFYSKNRTKTLGLQDDNCADEIESRSVPMYLFWSVLAGLNDEKILRFIVAGHVKNLINDSFGRTSVGLKRMMSSRYSKWWKK